MVKRYGDIISGSVCFVTSVILFALTFDIQRLTYSKIGSEFVPRIVFSLLIVLSAILITHGIAKLKKQKSETLLQKEAGKPKQKATVWLTLFLIVIYIAFLDKVGFLIMTSVYLFSQFVILSKKEQRKYGLFAVIAVLTSTIIYFLFLKVFQLMLPAGLLAF